ncbi:MAG: hypothetical protein AMK72_10385 [Planctomycetes bacterium SM23_25]|nr:MAG: hypothetical protein AMK72_10385 [Planctomycetes bacterium SM23_25]
MTRAIIPIVEGQSEVESVALLLRRVLAEVMGEHSVEVGRPFRVKRTKVVREGELERAVQFALRDRRGAEAVLVLLDADDDCPAALGPALARRAQQVSAKPVAVVLATRELEAWFLGAKRSLRGVRGIRDDAEPPPNPEGIRGAKESLSHNMTGRRYLEVDDQPALADRMDLEAAKAACPSFARLVREVTRLVACIPSSLRGG